MSTHRRWPLLVTLGATAAALCLSPRAWAQPPELPATIVTLGGRAEISRTSGPVWAGAALRDELLPGDGVRTLGGRLTVRTASGQALRLGPRTQVFFAAGDARAAGASTRARVDGGRLWVSVLPNSPAPTHIALRAGPVTVTARGGGAGITMNPDGSVLVGVFHGSLTCAGAGWERALAQDQELLVPAAGAPAKDVATLKRDKRDLEWIKWNEQQDAAGGYGARRPEK